jgi:hypothetical protein
VSFRTVRVLTIARKFTTATPGASGAALRGTLTRSFMNGAPMSETTTSPPGREREGLRWNAWNLLLLVPFLMIVTPWWNSLEPKLFGLPFFYWIQFVFVVVGVVCVGLVYMMTRDEPVPAASGAPIDVDQLDEGTAGDAK